MRPSVYIVVFEVFVLDYLDVHEKYFPTCLRNHWLEDAAFTVERWCVTFAVTYSIGVTCSATVKVLQIVIHEAHVDAILQCQKIIAFCSNFQLLVGVERAILAMHWGIHVCIVFVGCNHPSTPVSNNSFSSPGKCCGPKTLLTSICCNPIWYNVAIPFSLRNGFQCGKL